MEQNTLTYTEAALLLQSVANEIHISENDGRLDLHRPTEEKSWFWPLLKSRVKLDPDIKVVYEGRLHKLPTASWAEHFNWINEYLGYK